MVRAIVDSDKSEMGWGPNLERHALLLLRLIRGAEMFNVWCVTSIGLIMVVMTLPSSAEPQGGDIRGNAWGEALNSRKYLFPDHYSGLLTSLRQYAADAKIYVVFDPKNKWALEFKFVRNGREGLSLRGHDQSAFISFENTLYFARYPRDSYGCAVAAYDLISGRKLWETKLRGPKPVGHSAYGNFVSIRMSSAGEVKGEPAGAAIIVTGMESYTDYIEVLDRQTGASLAVKNYRVGFGPPPPPGGGFDGRGGFDDNRTRGYGGRGGIQEQK